MIFNFRDTKECEKKLKSKAKVIFAKRFGDMTD